MTKYSLAGKWAIVTGASKGIGYEIANVLSLNGANIIAINRTSCQELKKTIANNGKEYVEYLADLSDKQSAKEIIQAILTKHPKIDILVNNAGITKVGPTTEISDEDFALTMNLNLQAPYILCREVGKQMMKQQSGAIVNVASIHSFIGSNEVAAYVASKHGIMGLTKALANEWGKFGIRVNAVAPGFTMTDNTSKLRENQEVTQQITEEIPLKRWATPADIAWPVAFLASEASSYVNGHTLVIDGSIINT